MVQTDNSTYVTPGLFVQQFDVVLNGVATVGQASAAATSLASGAYFVDPLPLLSSDNLPDLQSGSACSRTYRRRVFRRICRSFPPLSAFPTPPRAIAFASGTLAASEQRSRDHRRRVRRVVEDGPLTVSGDLDVTDVDAGESQVVPITAGTPGDNGFGTFEVSADGEWTYTLDNTDPAVQALNGATLTDTITVTSEDGTDTQVITITITGANDAAIITGDVTGDVIEAGGVNNGRLVRRPIPATSIPTDVDNPDDDLAGPIAAGTPGDNGFGTYEMTADRRRGPTRSTTPTRRCRRSTAPPRCTDTFTVHDRRRHRASRHRHHPRPERCRHHHRRRGRRRDRSRRRQQRHARYADRYRRSQFRRRRQSRRRLAGGSGRRRPPPMASAPTR